MTRDAPSLRTVRDPGDAVNDAGTCRVGFRPPEPGGRTKHRSRLLRVAQPELDRAAASTGGALGSIGLVCPPDRPRTEASRPELVLVVQQSANAVSVDYQYSA